MIRVMRAFLVASLALAVSFTLASPVHADTGHFHAAASSVDDLGALVVAFDERGLGGVDVDYLLSAHAVAVYACVNNGGNHPKAANKETVNAEVSGAATYEPKNGRVVASIAAGPPSAGAFACPSGQHLVLASVTYTSVVLVDLTNEVQVAVADAARVFVAV